MSPRPRHPAETRAQLAAAPASPLERPLLALALAGLVVGFILVVSYWGDLPSTIPTHFDAAGRPDGYGGKGSLLLLPIISFATFALLTLVSRFPASYNYPFAITLENAARQATLAREMIAWLRAATVWMFTIIEWQSIATVMGEAEGLGAWFLPVSMAVVFVPIIAYFARAWRAR